ncbi:class I SAM-dependent methyltransferase [Rhizobiaceae bacterium n13]|uniref:class I SAM-dependent methyltransferase n=1 Tax=Ferirhizobium litorale TaxID=2927786 RepID=UPI0024B31C84|nr:class I SAM-dependent methyltransferase [Fererhizobium litorale]MDI7862557.1 class I SAM-dependent methyltransferase [Fererhizobium litorale]
MGKRSPSFEPRPRNFYPTPYKAVPALLPHLRGIRTFAEPCAGEGHLIGHLQRNGYVCTYEGDISYGYDALTVPFEENSFDAIITNPPWSRDVLHPMIERFMTIAPTWLLLDADWPHTVQAGRYMDQCSHIVSIGRLKWIEGTKHTGMDNCAWLRFHAQHVGGPRFVGREVAA